MGALHAPGIELDIDLRLKSILDDPVTAAVRFEVVGQDIDWFDLRIVIDVQGVNLSKSQIRQLVAARGGYVRMDDGSWMRLEIKLDADQREAVTRLGLDPFDLSGETHRMHALQLADPKAAEVFDPKAWERIKNRANDIKLEVTPPLPDGLNATLRPYQIDGFHFLAYLSENNFGGILADDMGLGKTIQSLTYLLWLFKRQKDSGGPHKPALIVCPKSVLDVWYSEAEKFTPELKVKILKNRDDIDVPHIQNNIDMLVLNYAQLRVCGEELSGIKWLTTILDEGQQIKNPDSKAAKCARELDSQNRLVLTGTPIENRLARHVVAHGLRHARRPRQPRLFQEAFRQTEGSSFPDTTRLASAPVPAPPDEAPGRPGSSSTDGGRGLFENGRRAA